MKIFMCRRKLELARHQLINQKTYVTQIKAEVDDENLVQQEQLVEKQLCKRVVCSVRGE